MSDAATVLAQKSLLIVFAYASAGLGHLRVTDALYHGLPAGANPILLTSPDRSIGYLHHFTSIHPLARTIMEWLQAGEPEELFTRLYRSLLRSHTQLLYNHLQMLLDERFERPETVLVVATHFALAHQLAAIKDQLSRASGVKVRLVVQVTDDSPQRIWYVMGADRIVVPSARTAAALTAYGQAAGLPPVRFTVLPYPVSPLLTRELNPTECEQRLQQVLPDREESIQVVIPVSGAAVGLDYFRTLIDELYRRSARFRFQVVAKTSPYTQSFLQDLLTRPFVTVHTGVRDRDVVEAYEQVYQQTLVAFEITKPSEQAFKVLIEPDRRGGSLLLLSEPVGRQEFDNLAFLERHQLVPTGDDQRQLWAWSADDTALKTDVVPLLKKAQHWRAVRLLGDAGSTANYIWWSLQQGLFARMLERPAEPQPDEDEPQELGPNGVSEFWEMVSAMFPIAQHSP